MNIDASKDTTDTNTLALATIVRKIYNTPSFIVYGDIKEITLNVGPNGMNDPGSGSATRTGI